MNRFFTSQIKEVIMTRVSHYILALGLLVGVSGRGWGQVPAKLQSEGTGDESSYPICGSHLLHAQEAALSEYLAQHPEIVERGRLLKVEAWNFSVGSTHSWYANNFVTSTQYLTASTCRAVGAHCYVFVEDSLWGIRVTQNSVDSVVAAFDQHTPADPSRGVYSMDVDAFGTPPDVDNDPRIIILLLNIQDGFSGSGGYVQGYFHSLNELQGYQGSNGCEIYYLDVNPTNLNNPNGLRSAMSTTAHEFQHMIHWKYDPNEITFVNEGCALAAEVDCGYPMYDQTGYNNETNHYLLDWRGTLTDGLKDYSRAARFTTYIRDQIGMGVFKPIVASALHGIAGLDAGLSAFGSTRRVNDILPDWWIANILDDRTVDPRYGYVYPNVPEVSPVSYLTTNVSLTRDTVQLLAARYLAFTNGSNLSITFNTLSGNVMIKAIERGTTTRVIDVTPGTDFNEPAYGTTYSEIDFVVMNLSQTVPAIYTYEAAGSGGGALEMKWDLTEPLGTIPLTAQDTVAVTFDGKSGTRLDSIRVALRRAGSITGGVWRMATSGTRPLAAPLAVPITASIGTTPGVPFPVPWSNWATVDLRAYDIDASLPFVVGFVDPGSGANTEHVMVTIKVSSTPYHSYTYLHSPGSGVPGWFYLSAGQDSIFLYLIRAYVSPRAVTYLAVYPGDANNDGIVDSRDVLPIGQYYGSTGPARQNSSLSWTSQQVLSSWSPSAAAYADCDGNGKVDENDVLGIIQNWFLQKNGTSGRAGDVAAACTELLQSIDRAPQSQVMSKIRSVVVKYMQQLNIAYAFRLEQNYPNPFNPSTTIRYTVPAKTEAVTFTVYNVLGEEVWSTVVRDVDAGQHEFVWNAVGADRKTLGSGAYFCRMSSGSFADVRQIVLIK
jgi:hypothetical protein